MSGGPLRGSAKNLQEAVAVPLLGLHVAGLVHAEATGRDPRPGRQLALSKAGGQAEFVTRFAWRPGSVAFWDNRQVWHMAVNDYHGMRRVMNRILLQGSPPVPAEEPAPEAARAG